MIPYGWQQEKICPALIGLQLNLHQDFSVEQFVVFSHRASGERVKCGN